MKKSTFFGDFKKFLTRGNILDLAVAVVIGAAFGKIVTSLVDCIIMPLISLLLGGGSFADLKWVIKEAVYDNGVLMQSETALGYGAFIQAAIDFLIIAFCIFILIRLVSKARERLERVARQQQKTEEQPAPLPAKPTQEELLTEIRDLLKERK